MNQAAAATNAQLAYQHAYGGGRQQTTQTIPAAMSVPGQSPYSYLQPGQAAAGN